MSANDSAPEPVLSLVMSTAPSQECAERIATALVEEGLAACVQLVPGVTSIYRWQGELTRSAELLLLAKTTRPAACLERLAALHPYEIPEGLAVPASRVLPAYLHWAMESAT
jgi:periplasmic divalent cation tolerance protein